MNPGVMKPDWAAITIIDDERLIWDNGKLKARNRIGAASDLHVRSSVRTLFLNFLYADQNRSRWVQRALAKVLARFDQEPSQWGVCVGAGGTSLHPRVLNLDIFDGPTIDIVHDGGSLPFQDGVLSLAVCQEVLEHVADFGGLIRELHRVLAPEGVLYVQVPFQIGYHSGPNDYWRFSDDGLRHLFDNQDWALEELGISVGHGTGFYRIAVEFFAVTAAVVHRRLYLSTKAICAVLLYPFKLADLITRFSPEARRIPGGHYVITRKRAS
jgi:SAM-dependent methyltransferase